MGAGVSTLVYGAPMVGPVVYGENASGTTSPSNSSLTGDTYGYNGAQSKLTNNAAGITLMGDRPYQSSTGRFLQIDPIEGGCANPYTYAFGDPLNHPDLSGRGSCSVVGFIGTALGVAALALGAAAILITAPATSFLLGAAATAIGLVGTGISAYGCFVDHVDSGCAGLLLGAGGLGVGYGAAVAGFGAEAVGTFSGGFGAVTGGAGVVTDLVTGGASNAANCIGDAFSGIGSAVSSAWDSATRWL
jgi:RHS repeat-associated protein